MKFGLIWSCILKDMIFTIFRDFSRFFSNLIFDLKLFKMIKKIGKNLFIFRAGHVDATWH